MFRGYEGGSLSIPGPGTPSSKSTVGSVGEGGEIKPRSLRSVFVKFLLTEEGGQTLSEFSCPNLI